MAREPGRSDPARPEGGSPPGEGVDKRQVSRLVVAGVVLLVAAIFVAQNNERVEMTFLVFSVEGRLWLGLIVALLLGALLGQAAEAVWRRRRRDDD